MKVSIITICYNSEKTLRFAIESVLNQTYENVEYIIIDGNSSDGTLDIIKEYEDRISVVVSEKDKGLYDAMNKGLSRATGEIIGFINSDDEIYAPHTIADVVAKFKSSAADVVYGDNLFVDPDNPEKEVRYWKSGEFDRSNYKKGWMSPHLATYIKKEQYDKCGNFRLDLKIAADYELMFRIMYKNDSRVFYLPQIITKMRAGGISNSSLKNIYISNYEVYKSWKLNGEPVSPLIILRKPLNKLSQLVAKRK